jgi:hypothetical protein
MAYKNIYKILVVVISGVISAAALLVFVQSGLAASTGAVERSAAGNSLFIQGYQAITQTDVLYLPMVSRPTTRKPLGSVAQLSGPTPCSGSASNSCYTIRVSCPGISNTLDATIKLGTSLISNTIGTVMFYGGFDGTYYWDGFNVTNTVIITNVRLAGFQTVQIDWSANWMLSTPGNSVGMDGIACRPATVARWVYDTFHQANPSLPYCAVGHSNGASEVAYSMTLYGLDEVFDEAILESGPNFSLLEYGCWNTLGHNSLFLPGTDRGWVDRSFGISSNGPCAYNPAPPADPTPIKQPWRSIWQDVSVVTSHTLNIYPHTMVSLIFGSLDTSQTRYHGNEYANWLAASGTPFFTSTILLGAGHGTTYSPAGQAKLTSEIINGCILR